MITNLQQMVLIRSGREAIEHALLTAVLRSFENSHPDREEVDDLTELLKTYNRLMARHQRSLIEVQAANDKTYKQEK